MKSLRKVLILVALALVGALSLSACDPSGNSLLAEGHYTGTLTTHLDTSYVRTAVQADVAAQSAATSTSIAPLAVQDSAGVTHLTLTILDAADSSITFQSTPGMSQPLKLTLQDGCYSGSSDVKVEFCPSANELTLEIQDQKSGTDTISLTLRQLNTGDTSEPVETPRAYTLTQAIDRARASSFESRIEYQHVIQAKDQAEAAYQHLLPQITLATVANNIVPSWSTALQDIGDLAPFLLPDRWFQAAAAGDQAKAEQDTDTLMRLDMGVEVEGLFYTYARDKQSWADTQDILGKATTVCNEIQIRENLGALPAGSATNMQLVVNQIQQSMDVLQQVRAGDLAAISAALGYFNPGTVTDATIDQEAVPISSAPPVNYDTVNTAALQDSFELDQMNDLIAAAQMQKDASYFSWLDPYGDPSLGLGAALPTEVDVESSQIAELEIDRDQLKAIISQQKAFGAVTSYMTALQSYKDAAAGTQIAQNVLNTALNYLETGDKVDLFLSGAGQIYQQLLSAEINQETALANFRVARAEIDRLLLQGYYENF